MSLGSLRRAVRVVGPRTSAVALQGTVEGRDSLSASLLEHLTASAPLLTSLTLHSCRVNAEKVSFQQFPASLTHLSLEGSEFYNLPGDRWPNVL